MKKIFFVVLITLAFSINVIAQISPDPEAIKVANVFIGHLIKNDANAMYSMFSQEVKDKLTLEQTSSIWGQITAMFGEFEGQSETLSTKYNELVLCSSILRFNKGMLEAKITVSKDKAVSGFFLTPKQEESKYVIPSYADTTKFVEMPLKFGAEEYILDGKLSMPKSKNKTPVVILVHGSGPHDMDETVGPNKPFKDIAWGLASNGVAVLRYNKRTKQHPEKMIAVFENADVYDEVIDDAIYAVNLLLNNSENYNIDKSKIYVLGHSLGGTLVPRIAEKSKDIAGLISMAGMTRRLENVLLEQYNYLFALDNEISADEKVKIDELQRQINNMLSPDLSKATPSDSLPLNMPAKYWMTFKTIDPVREIANFKGKILILQGMRDYQVTVEDFNLWKNALKNNPNATLKQYDDLNHLMQTGTGKSKPDEYYIPTTLDERVVKDINNWINK